MRIIRQAEDNEDNAAAELLVPAEQGVPSLQVYTQRHLFTASPLCTKTCSWHTF